jgi:hypothetical protein
MLVVVVLPVQHLTLGDQGESVVAEQGQIMLIIHFLGQMELPTPAEAGVAALGAVEQVEQVALVLS